MRSSLPLVAELHQRRPSRPERPALNTAPILPRACKVVVNHQSGSLSPRGASTVVSSVKRLSLLHRTVQRVRGPPRGRVVHGRVNITAGWNAASVRTSASGAVATVPTQASQRTVHSPFGAESCAGWQRLAASDSGPRTLRRGSMARLAAPRYLTRSPGFMGRSPGDPHWLRLRRVRFWRRRSRANQRRSPNCVVL